MGITIITIITYITSSIIAIIAIITYTTKIIITIKKSQNFNFILEKNLFNKKVVFLHKNNSFLVLGPKNYFWVSYGQKRENGYNHLHHHYHHHHHHYRHHHHHYLLEII